MNGPLTGRHPSGTRIHPAGAGIVAAWARHHRKSARAGTKVSSIPTRPTSISEQTFVSIRWHASRATRCRISRRFNEEMTECATEKSDSNCRALCATAWYNHEFWMTCAD